MLVICCTPLHTLIARAMLDARGTRDFRLIYYTCVDNAKQRRYYDRLAQRAVAAAYVVVDSRFPTNFARFRHALRAVRAEAEHEIGLASIDNFYSQYTIKKHGFGSIVTYDDGTSNVDRGSAYFRAARRSPLHAVLIRYLRGEVDLHWIRARSQAHYTLYPEFDNIVHNTLLQPVLLRTDRPAVSSLARDPGERRIFLGQPLTDPGMVGIADIYADVVASLQIDEYLPHPREGRPSGAFELVDTPLIAEEYLLGQLDLYESVTVFTVRSAALMNIDHPRLRKVVLTHPDGNPATDALYEKFATRGCELLSAPGVVGLGLLAGGAA